MNYEEIKLGVLKEALRTDKFTGPGHDEQLLA
jgi:hypothetical protein